MNDRPTRTDSPFRKAERRGLFARAALVGPSGAGKTYTALIGAGVFADGKPVAVIDTEGRSSEHYADLWDFDVAPIGPFEEQMGPRRYLDEFAADIRYAVDPRNGYGALVIDSLTHAWNAILALVDEAKRGNNSWSGWAVGTPAWQEILDLILFSQMHVIVTMRSRTEWVLNEVQDANGRTRTEPTRVGTAAQARHGIEYEFQAVAEMDLDHTLRVTKSRIDILTDAVVRKPDREFWERYAGWLDAGVPRMNETQRAEIDELRAAVKQHPHKRALAEQIRGYLDEHHLDLERLYEDEAVGVIAAIRRLLGSADEHDDDDPDGGGERPPAPPDDDPAPAGTVPVPDDPQDGLDAPFTAPSDETTGPDVESGTHDESHLSDEVPGAADPYDVDRPTGGGTFWLPGVAPYRFLALATVYDDPSPDQTLDDETLAYYVLHAWRPEWADEGARESEISESIERIPPARVGYEGRKPDPADVWVSQVVDYFALIGRVASSVNPQRSMLDEPEPPVPAALEEAAAAARAMTARRHPE